MEPEDVASEQKSFSNFVKVKVSRDRLTVSVDLLDPPSHDERSRFSGRDLMQCLKDAGITYGLIDEAEMDMLVQSWLAKMDDVEVARGLSPVPSQEGSIEYYFEKNAKPSPQTQADGKVDYRELGILQMVNANDCIAELVPGTPGTPGIDVYGNEIPVKPPKSVKLPRGKFTLESPDGKYLLAEINGQVVYENERSISVSPVFHVKGNVDFSTGNIHFHGSVQVHGNVNAGFVIETEGNIEVMGIVEASDLRAHGDIVVRGGIQGSATTRIIAAGSIHALYLQNAVINAGGAVIVSDSIMNCVVQADEVRVAGKRGLLLGGLSRVQTGLLARVAGSHMGAKTRIELYFYKTINDRLLELDVNIEQKNKELANIDAALNKFNQMQITRKILTPNQMEYEIKLKNTFDVEKQGLQTLIDEKTNLLDKKQHASPPVVEISSIAYAGVVISTGDAKIEINETMHSPKFIHDGNKLHRIG